MMNIKLNLFDLDIQVSDKEPETEMRVTVGCNSIGCSRICHTGCCAKGQEALFDLDIQIEEKESELSGPRPITGRCTYVCAPTTNCTYFICKKD